MTNPLADPGFHQNPYPAYDLLRGTAPVQPVPAGSDGRCSYLVTGYAEARTAFADPRLSKDTGRFFAERPSGRNLHPAVSAGMLATDPPDHTRLRRLVTGAFSTRTVNQLRPYITRLADRLIQDLPEGHADLVADFAAPLPVTVICQLLGVPEADRPSVRTWSDELFAAGDPDRVDAASHAVAGYLADLVASKRRTPGAGLLDDLIAVRDGAYGADGVDRLSEDELVSLAVLLIVAGHETTTNFIGNSLLALLQHPDAYARLRENPGLIATAVDELLRFDSPVGTATFRYSSEPLSLGGVAIPAGVSVLIVPGAANRDPARFTEPAELDLDRDDKGHLAFGHGIHRCLGAPLARLEGEIALRAVLTRFPGLRLAVPVEELRWRRTRLMRGLVALPVSL